MKLRKDIFDNVFYVGSSNKKKKYFYAAFYLNSHPPQVAFLTMPAKDDCQKNDVHSCICKVIHPVISRHKLQAHWSQS